MNLTKKLLIIVIMTIFIILSLMPAISNAAVASTPLILGITELRTTSTPNMGYAIGDPNTNGETGTAAKIWNIVKYNSMEEETFEEANIYCAKAGVGFSDTRKKAAYDIFFDLKTEREEIEKQNDILKSIVTGKINLENGQTVEKYHAILALIDMIYLDKVSTEEEKTQLLENANIYADQWSTQLTIDDIEAVQQAALWYFTNYGEEEGKYDKTENTDWLNYTLDGKTYNTLTTYNPTGVEPNRSEGAQRQIQAEMLYKYLIKAAKENASNYENIEISEGAPAKLETTSLAYQEVGSNYVFGPIKITKTNSIPYTLDFVVENNGTETSDYILLNKDMEQVQEGTTVKDLVGQEFYFSLPKDVVTTVSVKINIRYSDTKVTLWASSTNAEEQPVVIPEKNIKEIPYELTVTPGKKNFDLALRKYITKINGVDINISRAPSIDEATLETGTTATYKHRKDPVIIKNGDKVTYKLTIYNEGEKDGRATKIVDQLPTGLKFTQVLSGNFELESYNEETDNRLTLKRIDSNQENLPKYEKGNLSSETIEIECEVTAMPDEANTKVLTNVAWISEEYDAESGETITNTPGKDIDSEPSTAPDVNKDNMDTYIGNGNKEDLTDSNYYYKGQQDDDDFEKLILMPESFDLKLIKRIVAVNNQNVTERIKDVDVSKLNTIGEDGKVITTGEYNLDKEPVGVKKGDIVTYTFRIYNEGTLDGYAQEITEDIPEDLEFIWSEKEGQELEEDETLTEEEKEAIEFNQKYLWGNFKYDENKEKIIEISTDYLSKENETTVGGNLIRAFGENDGSKTEEDISYKEVSVMLKVVSDKAGEVIRNEAAITEDCNEEGNPVDDRDSDTEKWVKYEDDEDYDNIILQSFDLALRKFIIAVSEDDKIEDEEYLKDEKGIYERAPEVDTSKLNTTDENGKLITTAIYNHTKEPVLVKQKDVVVYMIRVYNEGDIDGYAAEIKDHLPPYLEFVEGEFNEENGWEVSEDGRTVTTRKLENELIKKAEKDENGKIVLTYKEVPIMCRVKEDAKTSENITNIADITEYQDDKKQPTTDRDSQEDNVDLPKDEELPSYKEEEKGEYVPGQEDDDDFEKVIVKIFDLALRKWVTQAIVIEDGKETITETGHQPYDDPEQVVKVELHRKKLDKVTVKFRYSIRVINEGELEGYAKEITDYIPEGLKFVAEDNPGWTDEGNNVVSTRLLENTLLKPGEYADVEIVLTWINNKENMGLKINTAEISEDYNEYDVPDKDSTPDNQKPGEDDIDDAPVILSIETGQVRIYFTLGLIILVTIAGGTLLIKKFVI